MAELLWIAEKGDEFDVPDVIAKAEGIEDMSWKNDTCPSFGLELGDDIIVRIWVDHPDRDQRENDTEHRFHVAADDWGDSGRLAAAGVTDTSEEGDFILSTDDPHEALRAFMAAVVVIRRTS